MCVKEHSGSVAYVEFWGKQKAAKHGGYEEILRKTLDKGIDTYHACVE